MVTPTGTQQSNEVKPEALSNRPEKLASPPPAPNELSNPSPDIVERPDNELIALVRKQLFGNLSHYRQHFIDERSDAETVIAFAREHIARTPDPVITAYEAALKECGKAFKRLAEGDVGQPENLAFSGWQMVERVLGKSL